MEQEKLKQILGMKTQSVNNPYFHHIHVKYGNEIHTFSHKTDCVTLEELLDAISEIFDEKKK